MAIDVLWVSISAFIHPVPSDAAVLIFALLLACHAVTLWAGAQVEKHERASFSVQRALEAAVRERQKLLEDLFPPAVVKALVAGEPVRPLVTDGAVVLYCDLVGFTRMCSGLDPLQIMRAMNEVYTVFE